MKPIKVINLFLALTFVNVAHAQKAEYPKDLQGAWGDGDLYPCPSGVTYERRQQVDEYGSCEPLQVKGTAGNYTITERCHGEGGSSRVTRNFTVKGNNLTIWVKEGKEIYKSNYRRCK